MRRTEHVSVSHFQHLTGVCVQQVVYHVCDKEQLHFSIHNFCTIVHYIRKGYVHFTRKLGHAYRKFIDTMHYKMYLIRHCALSKKNYNCEVMMVTVDCSYGCLVPYCQVQKTVQLRFCVLKVLQPCRKSRSKESIIQYKFCISDGKSFSERLLQPVNTTQVYSQPYLNAA